MRTDNTVLIAGAGLSSAAGLPTTKELTAQFLDLPPTAATDQVLQDQISAHLRRYWETVFAYKDGGPEPSFEDHFTVLDLAANSGHHLGVRYTPRQLRAIRRLSIHRVFDVLDSRFNRNERLAAFLAQLASGNGNGIITTNWDIAIERHLSAERFHYSVPMSRVGGGEHCNSGISLLKLHGSTNWAYCDCCGRLYAFELEQGKGALHNHVFVDLTDFQLLGCAGDALPVLNTHHAQPTCWTCHVRLSSRVATFSYAKVLNFVHFLAIWDTAFKLLRDASNWLFFGYSLPEADFQLRHMLKMAQLGRAEGSDVKVTVVVRDDAATVDRFKRFFGSALQVIATRGFDDWVAGD